MKIGIDIIRIKRLKHYEDIAKKVLSYEEMTMFNSFDNKKRKKEFLAGRWAAKEALIKATNKHIVVDKINIGYKENGAPYITNDDFDKFSLSISHEKKYAVAVVVNEGEE